MADPIFLFAAAVIVSAYFILYLSGDTIHKRFEVSTAWGGKRHRWFPDIRGRFESVRNLNQMLREGYEKVQQNLAEVDFVLMTTIQFANSQKPFFVPRLVGNPMLMLPPSAVHDMLQYPDSEVSMQPFIHDMAQAKYTGMLPLELNNFHLDVVRHQLTRKLPLLTTAVYEELVHACSEQWGKDTKSWRKVSVYETCLRIVSRAANRVFSGPELCRNAEFINACQEFTYEKFKAAALLRMLVPVLRPLVAPILIRRKAKMQKIAEAHLIPVIEQRLKKIRSGDSANQINDGIQWIVEESFRYGPEQQDPKELALRVLHLNMVAIHTTSITITNTILDLYSSPKSKDFLVGLNEECHRMLAENNGQWTKTSVNGLIRIDSAIKESMRCSTLLGMSVNRDVIAKDGIDLPNGIHVPYGVRIAAPAAGIHHDAAFYPNPEEYNAFRFSASREDQQRAVQTEKRRDSKADFQPRLQNQSLITTRENFLSFGHGRHACPGRFFAAQELKLMLAHIVTTYDIKPFEKPAYGGGMPDQRFMIEVRMKE